MHIFMIIKIARAIVLENLLESPSSSPLVLWNPSLSSIFFFENPINQHLYKFIILVFFNRVYSQSTGFLFKSSVKSEIINICSILNRKQLKFQWNVNINRKQLPISLFMNWHSKQSLCRPVLHHHSAKEAGRLFNNEFNSVWW